MQCVMKSSLSVFRQTTIEARQVAMVELEKFYFVVAHQMLYLQRLQ